LERFSIQSRENKTKVISLANHSWHGQSDGPIKARSKYVSLAQSAGKRLRTSFDLASDWMTVARNFKPIAESDFQ